MIHEAFSIFSPFKNNLEIKFLIKSDSISHDADIAKAIRSEDLVSLKQVHGNRIIIADKPMRRSEEADGVITSRSSLWLTIRAADCQQLVVYAPQKNVIGVIHAGWKGLKAGTILEFFNALMHEYDINASETFVGIGPSLCEKCAEFTDPVSELDGLNPRFFSGRHADLQGIADEQLDHIGVPRHQRERNPDCTKCMHEKYWSYRGGDNEKVAAGWCNVLSCMVRLRSP